MKRFVRAFRVQGVEVYVHWSVVLVSAILLLGSLSRPVLGAVALVAFLGVITIHEVGHVLMAQRHGVNALVVELYPIFGMTHIQAAPSYRVTCLVAWGGVLAQLLVAIPLMAWLAVFGYTPYEPLNALLALLGFYNAAVALFNLLPVAPLDGHIAWHLLPMLVRRRPARPRPARIGRGKLRIVK